VFEKLNRVVLLKAKLALAQAAFTLLYGVRLAAFSSRDIKPITRHFLATLLLVGVLGLLERSPIGLNARFRRSN